MQSIVKEINLNIGQPNNYQLIHAMQGDNDTTTIIAHLFNINKPYVIDSDIILFSATTPTHSYISKVIEKYDNTSVKFVLDNNMLAVNGELVFSIIFMDSTTEQSLSTYPSVIHISHAPDGVIQETDISAITDYILEAKKYASLTKNYYEELIAQKGQANGIAILDENAKVPLLELYDASISSKGITQLTDSVTSDSTTTAATPNSVKKTYDTVISVDNAIITNADIDQLFT